MRTTDEHRVFGHCLASTDEEVLRRVLGHDIVKLYSPAVTVSRFWTSGRSFSFHLSEGDFFVVDSDWRDTPEFALDYHTISVAVLDHPKDVPRAFDSKGRKMIGYPASEVLVLPPPPPVVSISILQHEEFYRSEAVRYDAGFVFRFEDGRRLALVVHRSILGGLECATEPEAIDEVVAEYRERLVLE